VGDPKPGPDSSAKALPSAAAYIKRGDDWAEKKEYGKAIADYTEALRLEPKNAEALYKRGGAYAGKGPGDRNGRCLEFVSFSESARREWVATRWRKEDLGCALRDLSAALRLDPKNAAAYSLRGALLGAKGEYGQAIEDFTTAIHLDPKDAVAYHDRGAFWLFRGEYDKGIKDCTAALRLDPKDSTALANRGAAYRKKGAYDSSTVTVFP
jgi:tetratricopeptide (TPR) repeat protein